MGCVALTGSDGAKHAMPLITEPCAPRVSLATLWPLQAMHAFHHWPAASDRVAMGTSLLSRLLTFQGCSAQERTIAVHDLGPELSTGAAQRPRHCTVHTAEQQQQAAATIIMYCIFMICDTFIAPSAGLHGKRSTMQRNLDWLCSALPCVEVQVLSCRCLLANMPLVTWRRQHVQLVRA